jgi:hypothetical protein
MTLVINFDAFDILPSSFAADFGALQVYILSQPIQGTFINLVDTNFIQNATWLTLDQQNRLIYISTSDNRDVGSYSIAIVQKFTDFRDVNAFTQFQLKITAQPLNEAPYFKPSLTPQFINNCEERNSTKLWRFKLPEIVYSGNGPIKIEVFLNTTLFSFFEFEKEINQLIPINQALNSTVTLKLTDSIGLTSQFKLPIIFNCNKSDYLNLTTQNLFLQVLRQSKFPTAFISDFGPSGLVKITFP